MNATITQTGGPELAERAALELEEARQSRLVVSDQVKREREETLAEYRQPRGARLEHVERQRIL